MTIRSERVLLLVAACVAVAAAVTLTAFALPPEARPAVGALGGIIGLVLLLYLVASSPVEVMTILAAIGVTVAAVAVIGTVAILAGVSVLLLCVGEIAAVRTTLGRTEPDAVLDTDGRLRESAAMVLVAAAVAGVAAVGSIIRVPGQIIAVMFGALAIAALGKVIATRARS